MTTKLKLPLHVINLLICDADGFDIESGIKPNWEESGAEHWSDKPGELFVERSEEEQLAYAEYIVRCCNEREELIELDALAASVIGEAGKLIEFSTNAPRGLVKSYKDALVRWGIEREHILAKAKSDTLAEGTK